MASSTPRSIGPPSRILCRNPDKGPIGAGPHIDFALSQDLGLGQYGSSLSLAICVRSNMRVKWQIRRRCLLHTEKWDPHRELPPIQDCRIARIVVEAPRTTDGQTVQPLRSPRSHSAPDPRVQTHVTDPSNDVPANTGPSRSLLLLTTRQPVLREHKPLG